MQHKIHVVLKLIMFDKHLILCYIIFNNPCPELYSNRGPIPRLALQADALSSELSRLDGQLKFVARVSSFFFPGMPIFIFLGLPFLSLCKSKTEILST